MISNAHEPPAVGGISHHSELVCLTGLTRGYIIVCVKHSGFEKSQQGLLEKVAVLARTQLCLLARLDQIPFELQ